MFFLPSDSLKESHFRVIPTGPTWFGFCHHLAECFHKGSNSTIARRDSKPSGVMNSCVSVGIRYALTRFRHLASVMPLLRPPAITDIPGPHISTLNVFDSFDYGFHLFFNFGRGVVPAQHSAGPFQRSALPAILAGSVLLPALSSDLPVWR